MQLPFSAYTFFKNAVLVGGLWLILTVEQSIGLPILFLAGTLLLVTTFSDIWAQVVVTFLLSVGLAILFGVSFTVSFLVVMAMVLSMKYGSQALKNDSIRLLINVVSATIMIGYLTQPIWSVPMVVGVLLRLFMVVLLSRILVFWEQRSPSKLWWKKVILE